LSQGAERREENRVTVWVQRLGRNNSDDTKWKALVPYAGTNRIRSAGMSQLYCWLIACKQHPDKKNRSLLNLEKGVKEPFGLSANLLQDQAPVQSQGLAARAALF